MSDERRESSDEPVAIAAVDSDAVVDWSANGTPPDAIWIPETLFRQIAHSLPSIESLNLYKQSRLDPATCRALLNEIERLEPNPANDFNEAVRAIAEAARAVANVSGKMLLVEGP